MANITQVVNGLGNVTVQSGVKDSPAYNGTSMFITKILKTIKNLVTTEEVAQQYFVFVPGPIPVNKTNLELDFVEKKFPEIKWGGMYAPPNCTARHKVAIIVPYRDREQHLAVFLNHMHPFLMKQQIEYGIFVIEQEGNKDFNRAKLMNVGFVESQRLQSGWQCFVFHDIDLLPLDTRNMLKKVNYHVARYKMSIARYAMLNHVKSVPNPKRYQLLSQTNKTFQKDGLSTLQYELIKVVQYHLYTHIVANIDERS
ncbi:Glycosyltransferase [Operophtera brumata]|uniref:Glycosyltransferase n=1 Tax=Operophtera brumata TaxID=104452 RepID=A0A0L7LFC9_OPEBR|nr:Glycosyltransferase [Operophtera brumata]